MRSLKFLYFPEAPLNRQKYRLWILLFWLYAILWLGVLITVAYFWNVSPVWKVLIAVLLLFVAPSIHDLFRPYENYLKEREKFIGVKDTQDIDSH